MTIRPEDRARLIEPVLSKHFPELTPEQAKSRAKAFADDASFNLAFERMDHANTDPKKDQEHILKASANIQRAVGHLQQTGWQGQKQLSAPLEDLNSLLGVQVSTALLSPHDLRQALLDILTNLAGSLRIAGRNVETESGSIYAGFGTGAEFEGFNSTKPRKLLAKYAARDCAELFIELADAEPKVNTSYSSKEAHGPFLDLVKDVFEALGIDASAETHARVASKDFRQRKSE
ncbi:MAG: hypothetical protein AAF340_16345 [Pseudomonadota bacterium]